MPFIYPSLPEDQYLRVIRAVRSRGHTLTGFYRAAIQYHADAGHPTLPVSGCERNPNGRRTRLDLSDDARVSLLFAATRAGVSTTAMAQRQVMYLYREIGQVGDEQLSHLVGSANTHPRGRPALDDAATGPAVLLAVRLTMDDRRALESAARSRGQTLSQAMREGVLEGVEAPWRGVWASPATGPLMNTGVLVPRWCREEVRTLAGQIGVSMTQIATTYVRQHAHGGAVSPDDVL